MPNRYMCDVVREIRTAIKVGRIDMIRGLTEEIQVMANRMEAKLADYADMGYDLQRVREFKTKLKVMSFKAQMIEDDMGGRE